ncbi:hypothetical protein VXM67_16950 [Pseudomonas sp. Rh2]|uniref:hypothetical protein n=1 Tax=unclassified Pseudomonas TaxID=196821 RepID=UPI00345D04FE
MPDDTNIVDDTLSFTEQDVMEFVEAYKLPLSCDCSDGVYELAVNGDRVPSLLAIPDPRDEDVENWFFWLACLCCGQSKMIAAARVWEWSKEKDLDDE